MSYITDLEIELTRLREIESEHIALLEVNSQLELDYKRLKRQLEKQRKSNKGKQAIIKRYRDEFGWLKRVIHE